MKKHITFPRIEGNTSRQAHCDLPEGTFEREFGKDGFFGPCSHIMHANAPTGWSSWEGPLRPQAFDLNKLSAPKGNSPWNAQRILHNCHLDFRIWKTSGKMDHLVANADGDDLLFIHSGSGSLFCDFGHMRFTDGDYVLLPRSLRWRIECDDAVEMLLMEATNDHFTLPDKGLVGPHAIFDPAMFDVPKLDEAFKAQAIQTETNVVIKGRGGFSTVTFPFNPLDAVGWHGDNLPVKINWRDIRPLMSHRYHLPPSAHTTFLTNRFVVCTFVPRLIETDEGALKVPFYHSNNDYDEIIFYHAGDFFSRDNIHPGMLSFHPCGFPHGPHPKAYAASMKFPKKETEEVAVMIDTRDAVEMSEVVKPTEWKGYVDSWKV